MAAKSAQAVVHASRGRNYKKNNKQLETMFRDIVAANVYDLARQTDVDQMHNLSARTGNQVLLKREDQQRVFTFKVRGACNMIRQLSSAACKNGIIAASAGNHAQGVAVAAQHLGIKATIVMPLTTPDTKVKKVRSCGATTIMHGDSFDYAHAHATQLAAKQRMVYVPPFDHPAVIAGQGTIAMELIRQCNAGIDAVFVPVGGGGLLAGITAYIKYLKPEIRVYAVEPEDSDCLARAMEQGRRVKLATVGLFADGVAVRQIGKLPFSIVRHHIDGWIRVSTDEICAAVKDIFDDQRVMAEPSGALSLAGLKKYIAQGEHSGERLVAINSGANTNFERLGHIVERAQLGEKCEAILAVTLVEKAGSFLKFCRALKGHSISEFNYRYADGGDAHIFVGVRLKENGSSTSVAASLREKGYKVADMSNNDMAITHVRHMVGGRQSVRLAACNDERLYRCEFPERPGALLNFLISLRSAGGWNISLFHYRNHGAAYGRALLGVQVPENELPAFNRFIDTSDYSFVRENDNPAYKFFLC